MFTVILSRSDFEQPTGEVNFTFDYVLESLGVPFEKRKDIEKVDMFVQNFETWGL